jgi:hypothetical protein
VETAHGRITGTPFYITCLWYLMLNESLQGGFDVYIPCWFCLLHLKGKPKELYYKDCVGRPPWRRWTGPHPNAGWAEDVVRSNVVRNISNVTKQYIDYMFWFIVFKVNLRNYTIRIALVAHLGDDRRVRTPTLDEPRTWSGATSLGTSATSRNNILTTCFDLLFLR